MATAVELKSRLRAHVAQRMRDYRDIAKSRDGFYADSAYGAVWAANVADAITDKERDEYLAELHPPRMFA